jgi:hypothetical protein
MGPSANSPEQKFVPIDHLGRVPPGRKRHTYDCIHFYPKADPADRDRLMAASRDADRPEEFKRSYVREATPEEMRTIPPCSDCGRRLPTGP